METVKTSCARKKTKLKAQNNKSRTISWNIMVFIPMLFVFVFNYLPMGGLIIAFKRYKYSQGIFGSKWVGLKNFTSFMSTNDFPRITWNTLSLNFLFIIFGLIAAVSVAILLYYLTSRKSLKVYQTLMMTPHFLSWVVVGYMAYVLLNPQYGLLNKILGFIGLPAVDWYSEPTLWPGILTIASVWKNVGMDCIIYYASLMSLDSSLLEAADVDGANPVQKVFHVIIPSLIPLIVMLTILKIGNIFRADFGLFYQLTRDVGALYSTTDVIDTYIFRVMRVAGDMSLSSAVGMLQSVVSCILVLITNWLSKKVDSELGLF